MELTETFHARHFQVAAAGTLTGSMSAKATTSESSEMDLK